MPRYQNVPDGHKISITIFELMQEAHPAQYPESARVQTIRAYNDILQGRSGPDSRRLIENIVQEAGVTFPERADRVCGHIQDFENQRLAMSLPYYKTSDTAYPFEVWDSADGKPRKIITQSIYDDAVKKGFPLNFFRESHFDNVALYCVPDQTAFTLSEFQNCTFTACRLKDANFEGASFYDTEFHTVDMKGVSFLRTSMTHSRIFDSTLEDVSLCHARLKAFSVTDCTLRKINFLCAALDRCTFGRIAAEGIKGLNTSTITMGGATKAESEHNRSAIYKALGLSPIPLGKQREQIEISR